MDAGLLPDALRPENMRQRSPVDYPISQVNPITGYRTVLCRDGTDTDFFGWLQLLNGDEAGGYIYIRRQLAAPELGSTGYVVMDVLPELLEPLLNILHSGAPLQVRFAQSTADSSAVAFLENRE
jgi:hypothetical protein